MATIPTRSISPVKAIEGSRFFDIPIKSGETFLEGAIVVTSASATGLEVEEVGADPSAVAGVALASVAQYAWKEDTFGNVVVSVPVARADQEFRGTLEGTYALSDQGVEYGVKDDGNGVWVIDKTETSNVVVRVLQADDEMEVGDVNPVVNFVFLASVIQEVS